MIDNPIKLIEVPVSEIVRQEYEVQRCWRSEAEKPYRLCLRFDGSFGFFGKVDALDQAAAITLLDSLGKDYTLVQSIERDEEGMLILAYMNNRPDWMD